MVNRNIEETLNLVSMQIHRNQTVDTCHTQQVSYHTWLILAVLSCPTEIRYHSNNLTCTGTLCSVNHQQQLHKVIAVGKCRLYQIHVTSSD